MPSPQSSSWKSPLLALIASFAICFLVYSPALRAGFNIDDDLIVVENPQMRSLEGLGKIWTSADQYDYWPLSYTAFWAQMQIWGENPLPFHAFNLFLHAINAWLLFLLLRRLGIPAAWLGAAIFAVHPTMVESAAWIIELKNLLSGLFLLLAAHSYLGFEEKRGRVGYALSLALFAMALLSKTSTVMFPAALLAISWWRRGEFERKDFLRVAPHLALAFLAGLITIWFASHRAGGSETALEASPIERFSIAGKNFWFYLGQFFYPRPCFQYPRWTEHPQWIDYLPALAAACLFVLLWIGRRSWGRPALLGLGIYALMLLPVSGFVATPFFRISFVADHFAYLALLGLAPLTGAALERICENFGGRKTLVILGAALLALLGFLSWRSTHRFDSKRTLFEATLAQNPESWLAHTGLGLLAAASKDTDLAEKHFSAALRLNPTSTSAKNNMGSLRHQQGDDVQAERLWLEVLAQAPQDASAHFHIGNLRLGQGKAGEAASHFRVAVNARPIWAAAHTQLGSALALMQKWPEAEQAMRAALRLNPDKAAGHFSLGSVLFAQDRFAEALESFRAAVERDSNFMEAWYAIAKTFVQLGRKPEAVLPATRALKLAQEKGEEKLAQEIQAWMDSQF